MDWQSNVETHQGCPCSKSELELFTAPPYNMSMERGDYIIHRPVASITGSGPIEFHVQASMEDYIDLGRTELQLTLKVVKADNSAMDDDVKVSTANLLLHTLFSQVDCKLNEKLVTPSVNTYPYKAYLETILSHGSDSLKSWLQAELYEEDDPCNDNFDPTAGGAEAGLKKRNAHIKESRTFQLIGQPHVVFIMQDKYLLPGVDVDLKFIRSNGASHLMADNAAGFKVMIEEVSLHVRKVKINPTVALGHAEELQKGIPAKYPLRRGVVTSSTIPNGTLSFNKENLITGQLPRRVFLGLVTNTTFKGNGKENPFNFQHFNLNYLTLSAGNQQFPTQPLTPDFTAAMSKYIEAFNLLYQAANLHNSNSGLVINHNNYREGYTIYGFDLTTDMCEGAHIEPIKYGTLRLEAHFSASLAHPINIICYAEYDNMIQIGQDRNVLVDYAPS